MTDISSYTLTDSIDIPPRVESTITKTTTYSLSISQKFSSLLKRKTTQLSPITQFTLNFHDNKTIFLPGQRVEGFISAVFSEPTQLRSIRVKIVGTITTSESDNGMPSRSTLFKDILTVFGNSNHTGPTLHLNNENVFPFSFQIPPYSLPPSYKSALSFPKAQVKYEVGAILIRPGHSHLTIFNEFTIPSTIDSLDAEYKDGFGMKATKCLGKLWYNKGHMDVHFSIPKGAYTSEEVVPLTVKITNQSSCKLTIQKLYLSQEIGFKSASSYKLDLNQFNLIFYRQRHPTVERMHIYKFTEDFESNVRHIERLIHFPIPPADIISPTIETTLLNVRHYFGVIVGWEDGSTRGSQKFEVPVTISGFPYLILDVIGDRVSIHTLPVYGENGKKDEDDENDRDLEEEEEFYTPPKVYALLPVEGKIKSMARRVKEKLKIKKRPTVE